MKVVYSDRVRRELEALEIHIAAEAGPATAERHVTRLIAALDALETFPRRCPSRPELGRDVRVFVFERRTTVAIRIGAASIELLALYRRGMDATRSKP